MLLFLKTCCVFSLAKSLYYCSFGLTKNDAIPAKHATSTWVEMPVVFHIDFRKNSHQVRGNNQTDATTKNKMLQIIKISVLDKMQGTLTSYYLDLVNKATQESLKDH